MFKQQTRKSNKQFRDDAYSFEVFSRSYKNVFKSVTINKFFTKKRKKVRKRTQLIPSGKLGFEKTSELPFC